MTLTACPDDEAVVAFLARRLPGPELEVLAAHFDACGSCRSLLADLARASADEHGEAGEDSRYVLLSTLGAGAMGVVQAAFDRKLDRKVALKFLSSPSGEDTARAQARLQREAQALAKLSHPNVVTVHEVGILEGEVYVAMELVQGCTLREWLAQRPRKVSEVLSVMRQAGEGLAAAHAVGLVHRDFKPDNVLVGDDGRVRVTDFGLARTAGDGGEVVSTDAADVGRIATLTQTGVRAGTPAYMAPEQRAGETPGARSDVYSFCVTLREAVTGARPGEPPRRRPPPWLHRAIERGLRARPEDRWPSVSALIDVLARGPAVTPTRMAVALVAASLAALGIVVARDHALAANVRPACPLPEHAFDGVWDPAQRTAVERSLASASGDARVYVTRALDDYRDAWSRAEVDTCAATRVRGEQSERLLDLRMACLDDRRRSFGRSVSMLAGGDVDVAVRSVEIVSGLPGIESCARVRSLEEAAPPAPGSEDQLAAAKLALDDARDLFYAGKVAEAHARIDPAIADVTRIGYAPLLGQLLFWRGNIERDQGLSECDATLVAAAVQALDAHDDATLARIWTLYAWDIASRREEARAWVDQAGAAIRRLGGDDELEGERLMALGAVTGQRGEAQDALLRARELLVRTRGADFYLVASVDQRLGNVAFADGRMDDAVRYHTRSLELRMRLFGIDHAATESSIFNLAEDAIEMKRPAQARAALADLGKRISNHPLGGRAWYEIKLGDIARLEGDLPGALEHHGAAMAIYDAAGAHSDPEFATPLVEMGRDLLAMGRPREAIATLELAETRRAPAGEGALTEVWLELGRAYFGAGQAARGRELVRRAQDVCRSHPDSTDPETLAAATAWLAAHGA